MIFFLLLVSIASAQQNEWFLQSHYAATGCATSPYWESAASSPSPCSVATPCSATPATYDYTITTCTGTTPGNTISGGFMAKTYSNNGACAASALTSVVTYTLNKCIAITGGFSVRVTCDPSSGAVQAYYTTPGCVGTAINNTLVYGPANTCAPSFNGGSVIYTCPASAGSIISGGGAVAMLLLIIVSFI